MQWSGARRTQIANVTSIAACDGLLGSDCRGGTRFILLSRERRRLRDKSWAVQDVIAGEIVTGLDVERMQGSFGIVSLVHRPYLMNQPCFTSLRPSKESTNRMQLLAADFANAGVLFSEDFVGVCRRICWLTRIIIRHCIRQKRNLEWLRLNECSTSRRRHT